MPAMLKNPMETQTIKKIPMRHQRLSLSRAMFKQIKLGGGKIKALGSSSDKSIVGWKHFLGDFIFRRRIFIQREREAPHKMTATIKNTITAAPKDHQNISGILDQKLKLKAEILDESFPVLPFLIKNELHNENW